MKPNQMYFMRNRGDWDFTTQFQVLSWGGLWGANISILNKLRLTFFLIAQMVLGSFQMKTRVVMNDAASRVHHSTRMMKFGLTFYRSEKDFQLFADGLGLKLEGFEHFWPLSFVAVAFSPKTGAVDATGVSARYQMPMSGAVCDCRVTMKKGEGFMILQTGWMNARFTLTRTCQKVLDSRF